MTKGLLAGRKIFTLFIVSFLFLNSVFAQTTVLYKQRVANYTFYTQSTSGSFDQGTYQLGMYSHGGSPKNVVGFRSLKTAGDNTGSARSLQVGDEFRISVSAHTVLGSMGFALLSSPSSTVSYTDRKNNAAISMNLDNYGKWYAQYFDGTTVNASTSTGSIQIGGGTTYTNFVFVCKLTAPNRMNITLTDGTSTSNFYDLLLNTSNPITDYSIWLSDDYDGTGNYNIFWNTNSGADADYVKNTGIVDIGSSNGSFTIGGVISNGLDANSTTVNSVNNAIIKTGTGNITLTNTNTYKGITTVNGGTLTVSADNNLGTAPGSVTATSITLGGGTLSTSSDLTLNSNRGITLTTSTNSSIDVASTKTLTYGGIITGSGNIIKTSAGTLTLSGSNTYTGTTTVNSGTLNISADNNLGAAPGSATAASITLGGGTLAATTGFTLNSNRGITATSSTSSTIDVASGQTLTYGGVLAGTGTISKTSAGTLTLSGASTYGGLTVGAGIVRLFGTANTQLLGNVTINSGATLRMAAANQFGTTTPPFITVNGTFDPTDNGGSNNNQNIAVQGSGAITLGSSTLTITSGTGPDIFSGIISGTGSVTKAGSGIQVLSGANTYSGTTTLTAGTLRLGTVNTGSVGNITNSPIGTGSLILNGGTLSSDATTARTILNAYTLGADVTLGDGTNTGALTFSAAGILTGTRILTIPSAVTLGGNISGSTFGITKAGSSTLTLSANNSYTGTTIISAGTLQIGAGGTTGSVNSASSFSIASTATLLFNRSDAPSFSNSIALSSGASTHPFFSVVSGTSVTLTSAITSSGAEFWVNDATNGGTLIVNNSTNAFNTSVVIQNGVLETPDIANNGTASSVGKGNIYLKSAATTATFRYSGSGSTTTDKFTSGAIQTTNAGSTIDVSDPAGVLTISSAITIGSGSGLTKAGSGKLILSGANTYTGVTNVNAGTLELGASNRLASTSTLSLNGGTFSTGSTTGYAQTLGTLTLTANSTINLGTGNHILTFANSSGVTWTSSTTLSITGWSGTAGTSGTAGKIVVGTSGLGSSQLAQLSFTGGSFSTGAQIITGGEVVPPAVPVITSISASPYNGTNTNAYNGSTITITGSNLGAVTAISMSTGGTVSTLGSGTSNSYSFTLPLNYAGTITLSNANGAGVASASSITNVGYITTQSGAWNSATTWLGGNIPTSTTTTDVTIAHDVTSTTGSVNVGKLTVNASTILTITGSTSITVNTASTNSGTITTNGTLATGISYTNSGTITINGTFQINQGGFLTGTNLSYSNGTLVFNHTTGQYGVANSHGYWPSTNGPTNVTVNNNGGTGVQLQTGASRTITGTLTLNKTFDIQSADLLTVSGTVQINANGNFSTNAPVYGSASTLIYNTGGTYLVSTEWTGGNSSTVAAGTGVPANITISGSTNVTIQGAAGRGLSNDLTVDNLSTLTLGTSSGGDIYLGGNYLQNGTLTNNGRAFFFTKASGTQTLSGSSTLQIPYLVFGSTNSRTVQLSGVDLNCAATNGGNAISFGSASDILDLNGRSITLGTVGLTCNISGIGFFSGNTASSFTIQGTSSTGTIQFSSNTNVNNFTCNLTSGGTTLGSDLIVNGTMALTAGTVNISGRTLTFQTGNTPISVGSGTITTSTGTSLVFNGSGSAFTLPNTTFTSAPTLLNFTINRTSSLTLGTQVITILATTGNLNLTAGNLINGSSLTLGAGSTINKTSGTMNSAPSFGVTVNLSYLQNGSQTSVANEWPSTATVLSNLTINTTNGVLLTANKQVNGTLTLTAGILTVGANTLTISGSSPTRSSGYIDATNASATVAFTNTSAISLPGGIFNNNINNLTINGSGGVSLGANLTVAGTLAATAGTLTVGANTLTLSGTVPTRTSGVIDASSASATVAFTNASAFTLPASLFTGNINNLTINGGGVTLGSATTVAGTLTLTSGTLTVAANTLSLNGPTIAGTPTNLSIGSSSSLSFGGIAANVVIPSSVTSLSNLTISNTTGVTSNSSISVGGTITVNGLFIPLAANVISGAGTLTGTGTVQVTRATGSSDFINQYTITTRTLTNLTTEFIGASAQGAAANTFGGLKINNSNGVTLSGDVTVNGALTLTSGKLAIASNTLTLNGTFSGSLSNSLTGSTTSNVSIGGSGAVGTLYFDQTTNGTTNALNNLTINNSYTTLAAVSLGDSLKLVGTLTPTAGQLATGDYLTLVSTNEYNSGAIGNATGNSFITNYITGNVTTQRYTRAQRGYRTLAHPFTTTQPLSILTDNIRITGLTDMSASPTPPQYGTSAGNPSAFLYDPTVTAGNSAALAPITSGLTSVWPKAQGLYLFVRGAGNQGAGGPGASNYTSTPLTATILDVIGNINQGSVTYNLVYGGSGADNFNLVGNPYPSAINLQNVTNIPNGTIYVYNPIKNIGSGDAYSLSGGFDSYSYTNGVTNNIVIPSMGAFYVQATANTTITFHETDKVSATMPTYTVFGATKHPRIRLKVTTTDGDVDEVKFGFDATSTSTATDTYDAPKLANSLFDFYSLSSDKKALTIDYRSNAMVDSIIPLGIKTNVNRHYTISLAEQTDLPNTQVVLRDKLLKTETVLSNVGDSYSFDITADTATKGENRFEIGLLGTTVLPVQLVDITAQLQTNKTVAVSWTSATELNLAYYNVQRSMDGSNFSTVGKVAATGAGSYTYNDDLSTISNLPSTVYYRLQSVDKDASSAYSKVVSCQLSNVTKPALSIYPNPVKAILYAQVTVTKAGPIEITVTDMQGKLLSKQIAQVAAGTTAVSVNTASLAGGNYVLVIKGTDGIQKQQFVKE